MQFGGNITDIVCGLDNTYDQYLTSDGKDMLVSKIGERAAQEGKYLSAKRNRQGTLDFVTSYWSNEDLAKVNSLLERYNLV